MSFRSDLDAVVLGVLAGEAMHGYEITRRINDAGGEAIGVKEGQLYPILHRLENDGLIAAEWIPQEGRPNRKVYRLTEAGHGALERKRSAWAQFSASVAALLHPAPEPDRA